MLWAKVLGQLLRSKLPKRKKALIVQTFVKRGLFFDCAVRPSEIKCMQIWIDKSYRYIWSNKKGPPIIQMEREHARHKKNIRCQNTKMES